MRTSFKALATVAVERNARNSVIPGTRVGGALINLPAQLAASYQDVMPERMFIRVEDGLSLHVFGARELDDAQAAYRCEPYYVFASLEGDPIALYQGKVWTAVHGSGNWEFEPVADSLSEYWDLVLSQMDS